MLGKIISVVTIVLIVLTFGACNLINPEEPIPSYIQVDTVKVNTTDNNHTTSHRINDMWVYVDNKLVGTYEVPFKVPVLPTGQQNITLEAGIKENGIGTVRVVYPFFTSFKLDTLLKEKNTYVINPSFEYENDITIALNEDFESLGSIFEKTPSSDTILMQVDDENSFEGYSGKAVLTAEHPVFDIKTSELYALTRQSVVYLEFNYNCTDTLHVGLFGREVNGSGFSDVRHNIISLYPTDGNWKKTYINLSGTISKNPNAIDFRLFFSASTKHDSGDKNAEIYLDNIKIIH